MAVAILSAGAAWWSERPPSPRGVDTPAQHFSAERAFEHLEVVSVRPHMPGSAEHDSVRAYLLEQLDALGFEIEVQETTVLAPRGPLLRAATVRNVLARKRGTAATGGVALAAHYDTQQLTPGAGDDGSGIAAILEAARALAAGEPLRNDLYVVITDAEELGLLGARGFVDEHPWWPQIDVLLSFEARGAAGPSVMFETNEGNGWVVRQFAEAPPHPTGSSLYYEVYRRLPNDTDFSVYKRAGVTGLNFALAERADVYHRPTDSLDNLSPASVQHHGEHALAMARHFGGLDLSVDTSAPNVVFFRVPGLGLISYPYGWVGVITLVILVFAGAVVERGFGAGRITVGGTAAGLAAGLLGIALASAAGRLLWAVVSPAHHELGSLQGRALYSEGWYALAAACLAVAAMAATYGAARRWFAAASLTTGALLLPLAVAMVAWWFAPGVSMLFLWPLVFAVGALHLQARRRREDVPPVAELAAVGLLAAPVILLQFPLLWTLFIGLDISTAPLLAGATALSLTLLLPLLEIATRPSRIWLPVAAAGVAVALALVGMLDAAPGPARPVPSDLVYALDRESGTAAWATMQEQADGWIERFVGAAAVTGDLAPFLSGNRRPYRLAPAPPIDAARAAVRVTRDEVVAGARWLRVEIESRVAPELLNLSPLLEGTAVLSAVNGKPMPPLLDAGATTDWLLQHFGRPPGGVLTVELRAAAGGPPLRLELVEFLMRLPPVPGVDTIRPPGWVAHAGRLTDATLLRQLLVLD